MFLKPENRRFENVSIVTVKKIFDSPLLNNLFISFVNLFISLIEFKTSLNNIIISLIKLENIH